MLSLTKKQLVAYTTPKLAMTTCDMSGRTTPLPVTLNAATYSSPGTYTLVSWSTITYPTGYTGTEAFNVTMAAGSRFAVRDVRVEGTSLVADISEAQLRQ